MTEYDIRRATLEDLQSVERRLRDSDRAEIAAQGASLSPEVLDILVSRDTYVGTADGLPVVAFGALLTRAIGGSASLWLLATPDLYPHSRTFIRAARPVVASLHSKYPELTSIVSESNVVAIRWLRWLGFTIADQPYAKGVNGEPFFACYYKG